MKKQSYHKYVFDEENWKFVGHFEDMYKNEDKKNYDSWFQETMAGLEKQISLSILNRYNFNSILDIGCGKGVFTHFLKKNNNYVMGIDISETAIKKAKAKYKDIEFRRFPVDKFLNLNRIKWDLIIISEVLSYLKNWKEILAKISKCASYVYLSLYLPPYPIGFVKKFDELKNEVGKYFVIEVEVLLNKENIFILGKNKKLI